MLYIVHMHGCAVLQDLTLAQLQGLRLGGKEGVHVPTLEQFLQAAMALELHR